MHYSICITYVWHTLGRIMQILWASTFSKCRLLPVRGEIISFIKESSSTPSPINLWLELSSNDSLFHMLATLKRKTILAKPSQVQFKWEYSPTTELNIWELLKEKNKKHARYVLHSIVKCHSCYATTKAPFKRHQKWYNHAWPVNSDENKYYVVICLRETRQMKYTSKMMTPRNCLSSSFFVYPSWKWRCDWQDVHHFKNKICMLMTFIKVLRLYY